MEEKDMTLTDILGQEYIQCIQDSISAATGFSIIAGGPDGNAVTRPSGWSSFCEMFNAHELKQGICGEHLASLVALSRAQGTTVFEACPHTGLAAAAVPVFYEQRYLGAWVVTQLLFEDYAEALAREIAERNNLSVETVAGMLRGIAITHPKRLNGFMPSCRR